MPNFLYCFYLYNKAKRKYTLIIAQFSIHFPSQLLLLLIPAVFAKYDFKDLHRFVVYTLLSAYKYFMQNWGMFVIYISTKFYMPRFDDSLDQESK